MRLIAIILLFICFKANATIYYVSATGSDAANGTSTGTPWQSIEKVNSSSFSPGDQVLFKAGDSFTGKLTVPSSGSAGNFITFGRYGTGVDPVFTGFANVTGWTNVGNIWTATISNSVKSLNTVLINGVITAKGRYPNITYLTTNGASTTTSIVTGLSGTPNYTGGEIVIRTNNWTTDISRITNQSGGTLTVYPAVVSATTNVSYFIQNIESVLDVQNEWFYDSTLKKISIYSTTEPTDVKISTLDTLVYVVNKSYIAFDNISFKGANTNVIRIDTCTYIDVTDCAFSNNGGDALSGICEYLNVRRDSFVNILNSVAFFTRSPSNYIMFDSCLIRNIGVLNGMTTTRTGTAGGAGIVLSATRHLVTNTRIDSTGYSGVVLGGASSKVYRNFVTNFCLNKQDGGGIYYIGNYGGSDTIRSNITRYGRGTSWFTPGIYLDENATGFLVDSNTTSDTYGAGLLLHYPAQVLVRANTFIDTIGSPVYMSSGGTPNNILLYDNIYYSRDTLHPAYYSWYYTYTNVMSDSNYVMRPLKDSLKFRLGFNSTNYNMYNWQYLNTGWEVHSVSTPTGISTPYGILHYNPTAADSTLTLDAFYIDAKGVQRSGAMVLRPYQSTLLFRATVQGRTRTGTIRSTRTKFKKIVSI